MLVFFIHYEFSEDKTISQWFLISGWSRRCGQNQPRPLTLKHCAGTSTVSAVLELGWKLFLICNFNSVLIGKVFYTLCKSKVIFVSKHISNWSRMGQNTRDSGEVLRADYKYTPRVVSSCYPVKCQHLSSQQIRRTRNQSCNEGFSEIFGEGHWYWIHDFVAKWQANLHGIM